MSGVAVGVVVGQGNGGGEAIWRRAGTIWRSWRRWLLGVLIGLALLLAFFEATVQLGGGRGLSFAYVQGYSIQSGWLCYGWNAENYHCTRYWSYVSGVATSQNTAWVPNYGNRPTVAQGGTTQPTSYATSGIAPTPAGLSQWAYTGTPAWRMWDLAAIDGNKSALTYPFGQCTWMAAYLGGGNLTFLGNAMDWAMNARARGLATGSVPRVGATVVFAPFDQGASALGHVAHVVAVYANGWFKVEEMNFAWNGGGYGMVSYRYAHSDWGTSFIYS